MVGLLRIAFVNTSEQTSVTIHVETEDAIECCELPIVASEAGPEPAKTQQPGGWKLVVPPGKIFGFVTEKQVKITNPNSAAVSVVYADAKDPWPQPPPVLQLAAGDEFGARYSGFLMAASLPNPRPRPIVMTLAPAHATHDTLAPPLAMAESHAPQDAAHAPPAVAASPAT